MSYFDYKGYQVYYDVNGSNGEPILILNGIMMSTKSWDSFINTLSKDNKIIRVDFLDQGQSSKVPNLVYTQSIQVELIHELLKHLNLNTVNIVGISYGGEVALHYALKYQKTIRRMVLFNTCAQTTEWLHDIGDGWIKAGKTRDPEAYYKVTIPVIYSPSFYTKNINWMRKRELTLKPIFSDPEFLDAMERLTKSAESHDVTNKIHKIKTRTLVVSSDQDYLTPMHQQAQIHDLLPNSSYIIIPNVGHASMYEVPHLFVSLVLGYINSLEDTFTI